jgi:hypothetical protein
MSKTSWTLERVIAELQALASGGETMTFESLSAHGQTKLLNAAQRHAGSLSEALKLAGVAHKAKFVWTAQLVLAEIKRLHKDGHALSSEQLGNSGHSRILGPARKFFGSWPKAVEHAGFEKYKRGEWPTWNGIRDELRALHKKGNVMSTTELIDAGHGPLVSAARTMVGSWNQALAKAGVPLVMERRTWNPEQVLSGLRQYHKRGVPLSTKFLIKHGERKLVKAAIQHFGSWRAACAAAVPSYQTRSTQWTKDLVVKRIRDRHREGKSLHLVDVQRDEGRLYTAVRRFELSWREACALAKIPASAIAPRTPPTTRVRWNEKLIIEHIRQAAKKATPLVVKSFAPGFVQATTRRYITWEAAMVAAGQLQRYQRDHANAIASGMHGDGVQRK